MSVLMSDVEFYGCANHQQTDSGTQGGAIDTAKRVVFSDLSASDNLQIISSSAADTTPTVTITGRKPDGTIAQETKTLNGQTAVACTTVTSWERLLRGLKSGTCAGDVAIERATATRSNTAQGGAQSNASTAAYITLDASASGTDDLYRGMVIRTTGGTGPNQIRTCIKYDGTLKRAYVDRDWGTLVDATTTFRVGEGMYFPKSPAEVLEVLRLFYNASADVAGGSSRTYYEKFFIKNRHATLALTAAQVAESADPSGNVTYGLESSLDGSTTSTDRRTAPGGVTINNTTPKNVANSQNLSSGSAQAVWACLTLAAGAAAAKTSWTPQITGTST